MPLAGPWPLELAASCLTWTFKNRLCLPCAPSAQHNFPPRSFALAFVDAAGEIRTRQARRLPDALPVHGTLPACLGLPCHQLPLIPCRCDWPARLLLSGAHQRQHWGCYRDACHTHWPQDPSAGAPSCSRCPPPQKQHTLRLARWAVQRTNSHQAWCSKMCPVDVQALFIPSCTAAEAPPALPPPPAGPQPYNASFYIVYNATGNLPIACASFNASTGQWEQSTNPTQYGALSGSFCHRTSCTNCNCTMVKSACT